MSFERLVGKCIEKLKKMNNRDILKGIGELLTNSQKEWAKENLRLETISFLKLRVETDK